MVKRSLQSVLVVLTLSMFALSCQLPTQPGSITVPVNLRLIAHDSAGVAITGVHIALYRNLDKSLVTATRIDEAAAVGYYSLNVPILGERYFAVADAPLPTATVSYFPDHDTITFIMPCTEHSETFFFSHKDSIPCGTTLDRTIDLGTICVDKDTSLIFVAGDFVHDCTPSASITSITIPNIPGLTIKTILRSPENVITSFPTTWATGRALALQLVYSSLLHQPVVFDGKDIIIDASPSVKITIHLKGKAIVCNDCDCPVYDSVSFGLDSKGVDTNLVDIGDNTKQTSVDLTSISNSGNPGCDVLFTQIKNFTNKQLNIVSFSGTSGNAVTTLGSQASLGSMRVDFTPITRGEFVDTAFYKVQKRAADGTISDCDTLPIIYHGKVGLGICSIDTLMTNSSPNSYLLNDTITNCVGVDENSRIICIKNIGDGKLRYHFDYAVNDPQFVIDYEPSGAQYQGEVITILPGVSKCFSLHFIPDDAKVFTTIPPTTIFNDSMNPCSITLPVVGVALPQCIHCLDGAISTYKITPTYFGGFVFQSADQFTFNSDPNKVPDISASNVTATTVTLISSSGTLFQLVQSNYVPSRPGIKICDDPIPAIATADCASGGGAATITAKLHDLILFKTGNGRCGIIYIDNLYLSNSIWIAVFQASYPID